MKSNPKSSPGDEIKFIATAGGVFKNSQEAVEYLRELR
jgi:hypothetical protein